jgi:hypothetical protein
MVLSLLFAVLKRGVRGGYKLIYSLLINKNKKRIELTKCFFREIAKEQGFVQKKQGLVKIGLVASTWPQPKRFDYCLKRCYFVTW